MKMMRAGGVFAQIHERAFGPLPDLGSLRTDRFRPELLTRARAAWAHYTKTEFRSIQIMTRFLTEVVGAGDPIDIYAGALDLVQDEVRHTELCSAICSALGGEPVLPDPVPLTDPPTFLAAPMAERALTTAITMLAVNETISTAFIEDLATRCRTPGIRDALASIIEDESTHGDFGWTYVREALRRFSPSTLPHWQTLVQVTLRPHEEGSRRALSALPEDQVNLDAHPEPELADLGLLSAPRQALLYRRARDRDLIPRLRALDLYVQR
jgi:hypothetical protein